MIRIQGILCVLICLALAMIGCQGGNGGSSGGGSGGTTTDLNPIPTLSSMTPTAMVTHMPDFTLEVIGSDFVDGAKVVFSRC
ncbi:MAG: hypothetical protein RB296_09065 [Acidobacteriota bacterium]|jgi:hypothetical protein|nr:hypothetical protein [Acidobacteriota bacterium]